MDNRYLRITGRYSFMAAVTMKAKRIRNTLKSFYTLKSSNKFLLLYLEML